MTSSRTTSFLGQRLLRHSFPAIGAETGKLLHLHGQGDFATRYADTLLPFRERGFTCIAYDAPGHGQSAGKRGHIPSGDVFSLIYRSEFTDSCPFALSGHSAGGLIALHLLIKETPPTLAWISSPLIQPSHGQPPRKVKWGKRLAKILPEMTVSTGVTLAACTDTDRPPDPLFHSRISLGWASELIAIASNLQNLRLPDIPLFITQGSADPICPAHILENYLESQAHAATIIDGALHEPFTGTSAHLLADKLGEWLDQSLSEKGQA